ncbi:isoprenylcysteine alpha-carbonyl methylesterase ICME-like isoform X1 [Ipomoea triloba]|uniref:isoprenylcysteine alpha-carbonyl methylesterase ICME-like isoform X1 n=1 Tax=Ipomoea triloba TaxID=35885 RepID=UPI00125D6352|nr:isoprenylcysteine alpha-carbonyl methylesterase ICME-like isoform X1 [Ipomoea triloba]
MTTSQSLLPISTPLPPPPPAMLAGSGATMLIRSERDHMAAAATTRILISPPSSSLDLEDDRRIESVPFLSRTSSFAGSNDAALGSSNAFFKKQRRRRVSSDSSLSSSSGGSRSSSFRQDVGRAASETYLVTRLAVKLLRYLGLQMDHQVSCPWMLCFTSYAWFCSRHKILGNNAYGICFCCSGILLLLFQASPEKYCLWLDLYLPKNNDGPKPIVAFVTGGAWIIGYKAWGSLLGQQLSERGVIVACIDYRNFPQATIGDMVRDASLGISFMCNNAAEYGGDPNRIYLMGQSAGAHIAACALVEQAIKEAGEGQNVSWSVSQIKAYFGLSGGYNLLSLVDHFHSRGLYRSLFLSIMEGQESLGKYSPEVVVQDPNVRNAVPLLPPIILFHGTGDYSIPCDSSKKFVDVLNDLGGKAESIMYEGKTHTDLFLQDPMRGGTDEMLEELISRIHYGNPEAFAEAANAPRRKRLVPEFMLKLAGKVSPF